MSNDQKIALVQRRLETAKQELAAQRAEPSPSQEMIVELQSEIASREAELQKLRQPAGSSSHSQTISGNAQVGVAVSGNVHAPITQQSSPSTSTTFQGSVQAGILNTGHQQIDHLAFDMSDSNKMSASDTAHEKAELERLVKQFQALLKQAEAQGKQTEAQTVAKRVDAAVEEVTSPNPDRGIVLSNLESLKNAAKNIEAVWPAVFNVAMQIASKIQILLPS
jgi:flagellin-like hook-associated protein FlgL